MEQVRAGRRVAVALHEEIVGGASLAVMRVLPLLEERGWEFSFWASSPSQLAEELAAQGHRVQGAWRPLVYSTVALRLPPGPIRRLRSTPGYLARFRSFLREEQPALVHANTIYTLAEAMLASRSKFPVVMHIHEMAPKGWKGRAGRHLAWTRTSEVAAISRACCNDMTWRGHRPRLVYGATPIPDRSVEIRESPDPFIVGTVGVVSQRKGTDLLVEAARIVREGTDRVQFRLVGPPSEGPDSAWAREVLAEAASLGVRHTPRADVLEELRGWDCFVLASRAEPFGMALTEAMASGLPVIGTAVDGIAEQIAPGTGRLVPPEDPAAIAEAVLAMAGLGGSERREMGIAARERVEANFTLDRQAEGLDQAYRAAVGGA